MEGWSDLPDFFKNGDKLQHNVYSEITLLIVMYKKFSSFALQKRLHNFSQELLGGTNEGFAKL